MTTCLYIGHNGDLGSKYCEMHKDDQLIIGLSRRELSTAHVNMRGDVTTIDFPSLLSSVTKVHGPIDHIVFGANHCKWGLLKDVCTIDMKYAYDVGVFSLVRLMQALDSEAYFSTVKSLTVISSISGVGVYTNTQCVYASVKAAQISLANHGGFILKPIRVNCVVPDSFPRYITTESVVDKITQLQQSDLTRKIEYLRRPPKQA